MPTLMVLQGPDKGQRFRMREGEGAPIGRSSEIVPLSDYTVSRRHAEISLSGRSWVINDLRSANGTYLNNKRLERPTRLKDGDQIRLGATLLIWDASEDAPTRRSGKPIAADLLDLDVGSREASILGSVGTSDDSMILASPAAAEAVRSWRVISTLLDAVGAVLAPNQLVERVLDVLFEEVPADNGFVLLKDERSGKFEIEVVRSRESTNEKMRANRQIVDHVISHREGVLSSNAMRDERFQEPDGGVGLKSVGLKSVICVPMTAHEEVLGVIYIDCSMSTHIYTEEQLRLVASIGQMSGLALEDARLVNERVRTERLAAAGETVASLSHYIKNILQGLQGGSDLVEMGLNSQAVNVIDKGWEVVRRNLEKIFSLTMNMLAFAKRREPRRDPVQLKSVLEDVMKLVHRRAEDKGVLVKADLEDGMPPVNVDEDGIHQVALNIINNAIDAVPKMTGVVNVKLWFEPGKERAILTVGDNGPGIPDELRDRVFDAFYSTKGHGGTGLGLAVAKKIVDEHMGEITVKTIADSGTLIRVTLPPGSPTNVDAAATRGPGQE